MIATRSPARALTLPAVPLTRPSAAIRRAAAATCRRSEASVTTKILAQVSDHAISRRGLLGGGAAAGAGVVLGGPGRGGGKAKAAQARIRRVDVAIVGAGFAGLTAAHGAGARRGARWWCSRPATAWAGACSTSRSAAGEETERGGTFTGPDPGPHHGAGAGARRGAVPAATTTGENVYYVDGERTTYSDTGPTGTAPPDPQIIARGAPRSSRCSTSCPRRSPWTPPGSRHDAARVRQPDARVVGRRQQRHRALPPHRAGGHPPDLRRRAARAVAAVRALLHRRVGRRGQRRHVRAQLQHARRRADVPLRRRLSAALPQAGAAARQARGAALAGAPDRAGPERACGWSPSGSPCGPSG